MKYPLQVELEKDLKESFDLFSNIVTGLKPDDAMKFATHIANCYYTAIKRITDICVNRKRY